MFSRSILSSLNVSAVRNLSSKAAAVSHAPPKKMHGIVGRYAMAVHTSASKTTHGSLEETDGINYSDGVEPKIDIKGVEGNGKDASPPVLTNTYHISNDSSNISSSNVSGNGNSSIDNETEAFIRKIWISRMRMEPFDILKQFSISQHRKLQLDNRSYMTILWACLEISGSTASTSGRSEVAFTVYQALKQRERDHRVPIPHIVFSHVMAICMRRGNPVMALQIYDDCVERKIDHSVGLSVYSSLLHTLAAASRGRGGGKKMNNSSGNNSYNRNSGGVEGGGGGGGGSFIVELTECYNVFRKTTMDIEDCKDWKLSESEFTEIVKAYSHCKSGEDVLQVLRHMTEDGHVPSVDLCAFLLEKSLAASDYVVLRVLTGWYLDNYTTAHLDYGSVSMILQLASSIGDRQLAQDALQLLSRTPFPPTAVDYLSLARACVMSMDFVSAVEALVDAQTRGIDVFHEDKQPLSLSPSSYSYSSTLSTRAFALSLQETMAVELSRSTPKLDEIYFFLVDLVRSNYSVPRLALNAIVMAAGRNGRLDRGFATFQEFSQLFGVEHDIHAYNSLLTSVAQSWQPSVKAMLSIFQDMEAVGISPDSESISLLLEVIADSGDFKGLDKILAHARDVGLANSGSEPNFVAYPLRGKALRRLCIACAKRNEWEKVETVLDILNSQQHFSKSPLSVPPFLLQRLENIKRINKTIKI